MKLKKLIKPTLLMMLVAAAASTINTDTRIPLYGPFTEQHARYIATKVIAANELVFPGKTITLVVNSIGGENSSLKSMLNELKASKVTVNTEAIDMASSAGAILFTAGKERTMQKDSKLMFHRARVMLPGPIVLTVTDLKIFQKTGKFPDAVFKTLPPEVLAMGLIPILTESIAKLLGEELTQIINDLEQFNNNIVNLVAKNIGKSPAFVVKNLLPELDEDITLTARQALELGVATKIKE